MYYRIIRNDISKSKLITFTTMVFVAAAALLVSLAAILTVNLAGSIDNLMIKAKTPHFMQMEEKTIKTEQLEAFAKQNENVDDFQVLEFLNVNGARININGKSLADSVQDNGFSTQSEKFDYLLDLDGKIITVTDGEIYVPICYMKDGTAKVGDKVKVSEKEFRIAGFLRDSQMNSLLASSKRFLVSKDDYSEIKESGAVEYLIEFRLKDVSRLGAFESAYTSAGFKGSGPLITYPLFKTLNAVSDGMLIGIILLVSVLVVAIAFMCIRFTLLAKIEDDYREIGVMKAVGLRVSDIKRTYLAKYAVIAASGSILGFALSFVFRGTLLENIRLYMGESENSSLALLIAIIGIILVFTAILTYVNRVLIRFKKIPAAEAIRFGNSQEKSIGKNNICLNKNKLFNTNIFLAIKDVLSRKRLYATMLAALVISTFIIVVPKNLYSTISSPNFVTYMGIGKCDLRIDIQQADDIAEKAHEISKTMGSDKTISKYVVLTTKTFTAIKDDGSEADIKVELGNHSIFPLKYSSGREPQTENEIALSIINADELKKKTGDTVKLIINGEERKLKICGIYSDITNGGKTAKAVFKDNSSDIMWSIVEAELPDKSLVDGKVSEYKEKFVFAKVSSINEYVLQTYGSTINSVGKASNAAIAVALIVSALISLLFIRMLIAKDRYSIAVMKAFGFTNSDIRAQFISRSIFVLVIGIVLGTVLVDTLGEMIAGAAIASFGASSFRFEVNPVWAYLLCPLLMACSVLMATIVGTIGAGKIKIAENIKE